MKYQKIAQRFSDILSRNNMTARELAEQSGVSESSISQYVNGSHKPSNINAGKIARVVDVNPLWVMGYDVVRDITTSTVFIEESQEDQANENEALRYSGMLLRAGFILRASEDFNDLYSLAPADSKLFSGFAVNMDINEVNEYNALIEGVVLDATRRFFMTKMRSALSDMDGEPDA